MDITNMSRNELIILDNLIGQELIKRKIAHMSLDELENLKDKIKDENMPLEIERCDKLSSTFLVSGYDIRTHSDIVEIEMKKYGDGGIDYYEDWEYDCFMFVYYNDDSAHTCQDNIKTLVKRLRDKIYKI